MKTRDRFRDEWFDRLTERDGWRDIGPDEIWASAWQAARKHYAGICLFYASRCKGQKRIGAESCATIIELPEND